MLQRQRCPEKNYLNVINILWTQEKMNFLEILPNVTATEPEYHIKH